MLQYFNDNNKKSPDVRSKQLYITFSQLKL